jgi:hypothetical protein
MSNYRSLDGRQDSSSNNNNNQRNHHNHHLGLEVALAGPYDEQHQQQNAGLPPLNSDTARLVERLSMQASMQGNPAVALGAGQPLLPAHLQAQIQAQLQVQSGPTPQFVIVPTSAFGWPGIPGLPGGLPSMFLPTQLQAGLAGQSLPSQLPAGLGPQNLMLPTSMNFGQLGSQLAFLNAQQHAAVAPYLGAALPLAASSSAIAAAVVDPVAAATITRLLPAAGHPIPVSTESHASTAPSSDSGPLPAGTLTGRQPVPLYLDCDEDTLSEYQCLLRKQIELFEATAHDVRGNAQGRNTPILLGQVGIRCRHCAHLPVAGRTRGAVYFSQTIDGIYQVAQNMSKVHLSQRCHRVPEDIQRRLQRLRGVKTRGSGGKQYWADGVRALGIYENGRSLCFTPTGPGAPPARSSNASCSGNSE